MESNSVDKPGREPNTKPTLALQLSLASVLACLKMRCPGEEFKQNLACTDPMQSAGSIRKEDSESPYIDTEQTDMWEREGGTVREEVTM